MSKLGRELDFDALLRAYDDGLLGRFEFYYCLLIRAEGADPEEYLARVPAEHRKCFAEAIEQFPVDDSRVELKQGFDPPTDATVRGLRAALLKKRAEGWESKDE